MMRNLFKKSKKYKLESVPDVPPAYASNPANSAVGGSRDPIVASQSQSVSNPRSISARESYPPAAAPRGVNKSQAMPEKDVRQANPIVRSAPVPEEPVNTVPKGPIETALHRDTSPPSSELMSRGAENVPEPLIEEAEEEMPVIVEETIPEIAKETGALEAMSIEDRERTLQDVERELSDIEESPSSDEIVLHANGDISNPSKAGTLSEDDEPPNKYARRKSVFAEQYDPAEDDDDEAQKVVYPKTDEQRQRLSEAVQNILLFRSLDPAQMQEVLDAMFERKVQPGEVVIRQGDDGDNFYVIESGVYNIYVSTDQEKDKLVGKYDNTGSFGELALMYNMPRAATIEATTEGSLWAMNRQTFRRIVLKSAFKKRKEYENLLETVPILKSLEPYERMNLCDALMPKAYKDGERIIKQGDQADGMYFIEDGVVRITMVNEGENANTGNEVEVSRLSKGQYFGELALVTHKPRAASVYAVGNVKLAFLDVQAFERLLGPCKVIMKRNINQYEEQLAKIFGSSANISDLR